MLMLILVFSAPTMAWEGHSVGFKLQDFRGAWHSLDDVRASKLVVIAFLRTDCPLAGLYAPKLADLAREYEKKGVAFFGVDANRLDAPSALARFAKDQDLPFPLLKDLGSELAEMLAVERTPEVFVLNSSGNFSNPDPTRVVKWGEQTHEEMLVGYLEVAHAEQELSQLGREVHKRDDGR
jgi:peroxiredoxin